MSDVTSEVNIWEVKMDWLPFCEELSSIILRGLVWKSLIWQWLKIGAGHAFGHVVLNMIQPSILN